MALLKYEKTHIMTKSVLIRVLKSMLIKKFLSAMCPVCSGILSIM